MKADGKSYILSIPVYFVFLLAMLLRKRQGQEKLAGQVDVAAYVVMGTSMLLFIIVGFRGPQ